MKDSVDAAIKMMEKEIGASEIVFRSERGRRKHSEACTLALIALNRMKYESENHQIKACDDRNF